MKGIKPNFQQKQKNRENTRQRKTIIRDSVICLRYKRPFHNGPIGPSLRSMD